MRLGPVVACVGLVAMFSACNAILGNESDYELVGSAAHGQAGGTAGSASGGKGGAAGSSVTNAGETSGGAGGTGGNGKAGRGGAGGAPATGGAGGTAVAGEGGADDSAGTSGDAGAPACMPGSNEDCFNGIDDDCDGDVDCEDAFCSGPAECQPAPSGAELGFFATLGETCPVGYAQLALHQDLQASSTCTGCSCVSPTDLLCDSGVYGHGNYACPSYQFAGQLWDVFNDRCGSLPMDPNVHYYSIRGTSQCTPAGTPTVDPPAWAASEIFCLADSIGGGCGAGEACLPVATRPLCTLDAAGCSADYASDRGTWYEGVDDGRSCSACSCGLGTADCSASYIGVYSDAGCAGNPIALPNVSDQGDACALAFAPQSGRIIGNPVSGSGTCEPNNFLNGQATPTNAHQVCCAP